MSYVTDVFHITERRLRNKETRYNRQASLLVFFFFFFFFFFFKFKGEAVLALEMGVDQMLNVEGEKSWWIISVIWVT